MRHPNPLPAVRVLDIGPASSGLIRMIRDARARRLPLWAARAADAPSTAEMRMRDCLTEAAAAHRLPPAVLVVLLDVEGGTLGHVSRNTNGTVDIGPMQVNTVWVPRIAARWHTTPASAYAALRDNLCANLEGGAWILRQAMDEARGDFWGGVGTYHSHMPDSELRKRVDRLCARFTALGQAEGPDNGRPEPWQDAAE